MNRLTLKDGTELYCKDRGSGLTVVFSHGWPLTADTWDAQMRFLASRGYSRLRDIRGQASANGMPLQARDGMALKGESLLRFQGTSDAEVLVFDMAP